VIAGNKDLNPVEYFERALAVDPANAFAHAMWATMCATKFSRGSYLHDKPGCGDDYDDHIETARRHYAAAGKSGQHREYINDIRLKTLLYFTDRSAGVHMIDLVKEIKESDTSMSMENKYLALEQIADIYMSQDGFYRKKDIKQGAGVEVRDALSAAEWLFEDIDYKKLSRQQSEWHHRVLMARLNELAGNANKAIEIYCSTRLDAKAGRNSAYTFHIQTDIDNSLLQLLKIRRGSLGVRLRLIDRQLAQSFGLSEKEGAESALVEEVTAGGGAEKAGIKVGDVILKVNGIGITYRLNYFMSKALGLALAGDVVEVFVFRDGQRQLLKVTLKELEPSDAHMDGLANDHYKNAYLVDRALYGAVHVKLEVGDVWLADLIDELREAFEVNSGIDGVAVIEEQDSGLRSGQIITEVNQVQVSSASKVVELAKDAQSSGKESIAITILDKGTRKTLAIRLASDEGK
jgi:C-terminal processing protease CtpA/Prc